MSGEEKTELAPITKEKDSEQPFIDAQDDPNNPLNRTFSQIFWLIIKIGAPINLTYTIGYGIWAASVFLSKTVDHLPEEDRVAFLAFIAVMPNFFTTAFFFLLSPILGVYPSLEEAMGELSSTEETLEALGAPATTEAAARSEHDSAQLNELEQKAELLREKVSHINAISLTLATAGAATSILLYVFSKDILSLWQDEAVAEYSHEYLQIMAIAMMAIFWRVGVEPQLFVGGHQLAVGTIDIITFAAATITAAVLSQNLVDTPLMAIPIIAWCYVAESWATSIANIIYLLCHPKLKPFGFHKLCGHSKEARKGTVPAVVSQSLSSMINMLMEVFVAFVITLVAAQINPEDEAALSFSLQLFNVANILTGAMSMGGGLALKFALGYMKGEQKYQATTAYLFASILANLTFILPLAIATWAFPNWLILAFSTLGTDAANSSDLSLGLNGTTPSALYTTLAANASDDIALQIEEKNALFGRITAAILVLETMRYCGVFSARNAEAPWAALIICLIGLSVGVGSGVAAAFYFQDISYLLLGWLGGLAQTDGVLIPLAAYLNSQEGVEKTEERKAGGIGYEMRVMVPAAFRWMCRGFKSKASDTSASITRTLGTMFTAADNPEDPEAREQLAERSFEMINSRNW